MKRVIASLDVDALKGFTVIANEIVIVDGEMIVGELKENHKLASFITASRDWHPPAPVWEAKVDSDQFKPVKGENVDVMWKLHCVAGTLGAEFLDGLPAPMDYDYLVSKGLDPDVHPYGAVYHDLKGTRSTGLKEFYKVNGVTTVIVGGLATDHCVLKTVQQLAAEGFEVILNAAACRGVTPETTSKAIAAMSEIALVCNDAVAIREYLA